VSGTNRHGELGTGDGNTLPTPASGSGAVAAAAAAAAARMHSRPRPARGFAQLQHAAEAPIRTSDGLYADNEFEALDAADAGEDVDDDHVPIGASTNSSVGRLDAPAPPRIVPLPPVAQAFLGATHSAFLTTDGRLFTCGEGNEGQLGHGGALGPAGSWHGGGQGQAGTVTVPTEVIVKESESSSAASEGSVPVATAAVSRHFTLLLTRDGRVWAAGSSFDHALGVDAASLQTAGARGKLSLVESTLTGLPTSVGDSDGPGTGAGGRGAYTMQPEPVRGLPPHSLDPVVSIGAGLTFSIAATRSGRVFFWGRLGHGGVANELKRAPKGVSVAASDGKDEGKMLVAPAPLELILPRWEGTSEAGPRLSVSCGLHHAAISFPGDAASGLLPRLWLVGDASVGALGLGADVCKRGSVMTEPAEVDLKAIFAKWTPEAVRKQQVGDGSPFLVACGPYTTVLSAWGRLFLTGKIASPFLLGGAGSGAYDIAMAASSAAATSPGKAARSASSAAAARLRLLQELSGDGEDGGEGAASPSAVAAVAKELRTTRPALAQLAATRDAGVSAGAGAGSVIVYAPVFVPILDPALPSASGTGSGPGRLKQVAVGAAHVAAVVAT
jgi:hypothetical protein